jgi:hypothetical protein
MRDLAHDGSAVPMNSLSKRSQMRHDAIAGKI